METTLFLQSEVQNPYEIYMRNAPVFFDTKNNIVAIYGHDQCREILNDPRATIPEVKENGLNEAALLIRKNLVRLANPPTHAVARKAAMELFSIMRPVDTTNILDQLIGTNTEIEWVNMVCKKLPLLYLLKSFGFNEEACNYFLGKIGSLTGIMLPDSTVINNISHEIYKLIAAHITQDKNLLPLYVSNLAGLLIQSYDATRGLLSNTLLQVLNNGVAMKNKQFFIDATTETLRFDPPVHNTKRILQGQTMLLVLAAANRDPTVFYEPNQWNITRKNNAAHIGFGSGAHTCPAHNWAVNLTADTLFYLFNKFSVIDLEENVIKYEPLVNLRLPCSIRLRCLL